MDPNPLLVSLSTSTCTVIDSSTTQCLTQTPIQVTYYDWLIVNGIIIFILSFLLWGFFFSLWRGTQKYKL